MKYVLLNSLKIRKMSKRKRSQSKKKKRNMRERKRRGSQLLLGIYGCRLLLTNNYQLKDDQ